MNTRRKIIRSSLCCAALIAGAVASGQAQGGNEGDLRLRFGAFELPFRDMAFVLREMDPEGRVTAVSEPFGIPTAGLGVPMAVDSRRFDLAVLDSSPDGADPSMRTVARIELPETGRSFIVMLLPDGDRAGRLSPSVLRADTESFAASEIRLFNLGPARVAWRLGEATGILGGYGRDVVPAPVDREDSEGAYSVEFYYEKADGPERFGSTRWVYRPKVRSFVFFYPKPSSARYGYRVLEDFPGWVKRP